MMMMRVGRRTVSLPGLAAVGALLLLSVPTLAQERFDVSGMVTDTTDVGLPGATVMVVQEADSTLVSFGITRGDGAFRISRVPAGSYLLQVTFVGYAAHSQAIAVTDGPLDVGQIMLREAVADLDELVVTAQHVPMVVRRDTLEYNAAAFRVAPGANVEELLRRLPGIEVERDGTIRAQGEEVRQVLVDGREFFGNDPTVATRNLPADAVDRVQVYDRRSDRAEFTGMDDGDEQRTINLDLRPDRRQGYFGNATAGLGDLMRYEGRASVNRFRSGTQLSLITNVNNINQQGFSVRDFVSFMGGPEAFMEGRRRGSLGNVPLGQGMASGFSTTFSGGLNLNHDFTPRTSLRASYLGYYLDHEQDRNVLQRQLAGAAAASVSEQQVDQLSRQLSHRLNLNASHEFGDGHDIRLRSNFQLSDSDLQNISARETRNATDELENVSQTSYFSDNESLSGDATLTYRRRFAPGRTAVAEVRSSVSDGELTGELRSLSQLYREGNVLTSEELDQLQSELSRTFTHSQRLSFTEPLGRRQLLQLDLEHRATSEDRDRAVFDLTPNGPELDAGLSSGFERTYRYYRGGLSFRRAVDPLNVRLGLDFQQARLEGTILDADAAVDGRFFRVLPAAALGYAFSPSRNIELRYNAATREPSMRDLQPFADNSDPLNVYVGNPDLRPEYTHAATLRFVLWDQFTSTNLFASLRGSYTLDRIVRARTIDEHLRQTVTMMNADGDWSLSGSVNFGTLVRPLGVRLNASTQTVYNRGIEFINAEANTSNILRSTVELRVENRNKDTFDAMVGGRVTYNDVRYSLNPGLDRSYANQTVFGELAYQPNDDWRLMTGLDYHFYSQGVSGTAGQVPLLRAEVSRGLLDNRLRLSIEANDLLNRNLGVNYSNTSTYIQEERIDTLGRYVMVKLTYNLAGAVRPGGGGIRVMGR